MGTGRFAPPPRESPEYRRGYLCGLIRGDGHLISASYVRQGGAKTRFQRFRLALTDFEALARAKRYLADMAIETSEFQFVSAAGNHREVHAIRTQAQDSVSMVREGIEWPA